MRKAALLSASVVLAAAVVLVMTPAAGQAPPSGLKVESQKRGCPPIPASHIARMMAAQRGAPHQKGEVVPSEALDEKLRWVRCELPAVPPGLRGTARLSIEVDEDGKVTRVVSRGVPKPQELLDAVASAARDWRVQPPRANGVPVKTAFSVDFRFMD